ncbi:TetR/AcrR family transcriptional regulator [Pseudonocardia xinjiangensis]|uniref:TetR/AcrR family transcriptional regulator n=1 Tax=Pseudonocardia xinjiangensis TaxID=75289 RepID=UPI003D8DEB6E
MDRVLTRKGEATRARIVEGAAEVLRERGVVPTTLDDIRIHTATSKGQLFHYFPDGKEQLLLAVAEFEANRVLDDQEPHLSGLTSWEAWDRWRDVVVERYRRQGESCPLGSLVLQVGRSTPGARAVVLGLLRTWEAALATGIRAMQEQGRLPASLDIDQSAAALLAGIQGGVTIMLSTGESRHLEAALDTGIARLRALDPSSP